MVTTNYAPFFHNVDAPDHGRAFRVTDEGGLNIEVAAGRARIDQTVFNFAAATPFLLLAASTYRIYISNLGVITAAVVGAYPANSIPLAVVVTGVASITSITDERCFFSEDTGGAGGVQSRIQDADNDTYIETDAGAADPDQIDIVAGGTTLGLLLPGAPITTSFLKFNSHEDLDGDTKIQVEEAADEDKVRIDTGGTQRVLIDPLGVQLESTLALMGTPLDAFQDFYINIAQTETVARIKTAVRVNSQLTGTVGLRGFTGVQGAPSYFIPDGDAGASVTGLDFTIGGSAFVGVSGTISELFAIKGRHASVVITSGETLTITDVKGLYLAPSSVTAFAGTTLNITRWKGIHIANHTLTDIGILVLTDYDGIHIEDQADAVIVNQYGIRIDDATLATTINRMLELGPAVTGGVYLRLEGSGEFPGAVGTTPLHLAEVSAGPVTTMRRVQWKDGAAIGAGDKVMVLV